MDIVRRRSKLDCQKSFPVGNFTELPPLPRYISRIFFTLIKFLPKREGEGNDRERQIRNRMYPPKGRTVGLKSA